MHPTLSGMGHFQMLYSLFSKQQVYNYLSLNSWKNEDAHSLVHNTPVCITIEPLNKLI